MADKQKISALLDGEELDQSIINALAADDDCRESWQHYSLIGDVMRGEAPQNPDWDITARVAMALEDEPAHQGPVETEPAPVVDLATVREQAQAQPSPQQAKRTLPAWLTQLGQVAVAASVSLAVIVGVQQYNGGEETLMVSSEESQVPVLQTIPFAGVAEPVSLTRDSVRSSNHHAAPSEAQVMEQRRRINAMLQDYELQLRLNAEDGSIDRALLEQH
ncbi:RseA family anti-sigma factor [Photobacterium atrarenae]|uniref:Anti-sigma-E factor RseA n=1 Tax=Photobacterium atrarenae TaxID=865757 RepID=A0ABY5GFX7_9GAMM|nr:RseA family anti-sigma factor [Photobacterium atrarenae]UTV28178.1 RseA family anti-sigma factor [Photobacterium atrarenae]